MKTRTIFIITSLFFLGISRGTAQSPAAISPKSFQIIAGKWYGSLTYMDYSSNKPYTMPAELLVKQTGKNTFIFSNMYPDEPKANGFDTIIISGNGKMINEETVKSTRKLSNGEEEIVTEYAGRDGNDHKPATIRHTYTLGKNIFSRRKDVQFTGQKEWIKRNEYSYTRNKADR